MSDEIKPFILIDIGALTNTINNTNPFSVILASPLLPFYAISILQPKEEKKKEEKAKPSPPIHPTYSYIGGGGSQFGSCPYTTKSYLDI